MVAAEKILDKLGESVDEVASDTSSWTYWHRGSSREKARQAAALARRQQENVERTAQGLTPLPEDPESMGFNKISAESSRLDALLLGTKMSMACETLESLSGAGIAKAYTAQALQEQKQVE